MEVGKRDYNQLWEANDKTKKLDEIKVAYSTLYGTTEFTLALAKNFVNILNESQPDNKQNVTIAYNAARVFYGLWNEYRLQLGLKRNNINQQGYFEASIDRLKDKYLVNQRLISVASDYLVGWGLLEVDYKQLIDRPEFKKRLFKLNIKAFKNAVIKEWD